MSKEEEEEQGRGFKVADRRRFVDSDDAGEDTPAGDEKPDAGAAEAAPAADAPSASELPPDAAAEPGAAGEAGPFPEMTFSTFVISLMTQALMHLGEVVQEGQPPVRDLPAAKQMIDLLGILRDKTTGNLDANEEQLLGQMLYDLRMRYVEVSRGS